jgi:hypothetical protein
VITAGYGARTAAGLVDQVPMTTTPRGAPRGSPHSTLFAELTTLFASNADAFDENKWQRSKRRARRAETSVMP